MAAIGWGGGSSNEESKVEPMVGIDLLDNFLKLQPPKFRGTANPSKLDD